MKPFTHPTTAVEPRTTNRSQWLLRGVAALMIVSVIGLGSIGASQGPTRGYLVIVHPGIAVSTPERRFLEAAFLKKVTEWPNGAKIRPIDLRRNSPVRKRFSDEVLGRSVTAIANYWRQVIFSGRGVPPPELESDDEVVRFVLRYPGAVGYVSEHANLHGARVLDVR